MTNYDQNMLNRAAFTENVSVLVHCDARAIYFDQKIIIPFNCKIVENKMGVRHLKVRDELHQVNHISTEKRSF